MSTESKRVAAASAALAYGVPPEAVITQLNELGISAQDSGRILEMAVRGLRKAASVKDSATRKSCWYLETLRLLEDEEATLPEVESIDALEFYRNFYTANRPLVLRGLAEHWKARELWSPTYLVKQFGGENVHAMYDREQISEYETHPERFMRKVSLQRYVTDVLSVSNSNSIYMVGYNDNLNEALAPLQGDIGALPNFLDASKLHERCSFWFGPAGTITGLHHDPVNNVLVQIYGRKEVTLFSPTQTRFLYPSSSAHCYVDVDEPDYVTYPNFRYARSRRILLQPGDGLFIPVGWWHHVKALDVSISLSLINFTSSNSFSLETF